MEKHVGDWKGAIVSGKVHTETEISVMKHEVVAGVGCYPKARKNSLLQQNESEETQGWQTKADPEELAGAT